MAECVAADKMRILLRPVKETGEWFGEEARRYGISRNALMLIALEEYKRQREMQGQLPGIIEAANKMAEVEARRPLPVRPAIRT